MVKPQYTNPALYQAGTELRTVPDGREKKLLRKALASPKLKGLAVFSSQREGF